MPHPHRKEDPGCGPLLGIHHVAIIASDYAKSKRFYVETLGCKIVAENYRAERQSFKLDLALPDGSQLELFSFPQAPARRSRPEACGLRHLAFRVDCIADWTARLACAGIAVEDIRIDEYTGHRFVFFCRPRWSAAGALRKLRSALSRRRTLRQWYLA